VGRSRRGVTEGTINGWRAVHLTNGALAVTVLPGKGADIYAITDLATGLDPLFKAPWGLQPPGAPAREGSDGAAFLENYEGGWQELLPNTNDACAHQGTPVPFHGEVATRPWSVSVEADDGERVAVRLTADCETVPLRLERLMSLRSGERRLVLDERVTNRSGEPADFVWGHHCVLGPPLVAAGAELRTPAATIITPPEPWEDTARLEPGQRSAWPRARRRGGGEVDLSRVPGPEAASHDDVFLTGLGGGWAEVGQSALGVAFRLEWDPAVFGWIISWQAFGGARAMPLRGAYALGIEPWATGGNLEQAVTEGNALRLAGHARLETRLVASIVDWPRH
jgi:Domain of unknown function (DUF4432)